MLVRPRNIWRFLVEKIWPAGCVPFVSLIIVTLMGFLAGGRTRNILFWIALGIAFVVLSKIIIRKKKEIARIFSHRIRLKWEGFIYLSLFVVITFISLLSTINLMYLILAMMLAGSLVSFFASSANMAGITISRPQLVEGTAGNNIRLQISIGNKKPYINSYMLLIEDNDLDKILGYSTYFYLWKATSGFCSTLQAEICFPSRGIFTLERFNLVSRFPYGLYEKVKPVDIFQKIIIFPRIGMLIGKRELIGGYQRTSRTPSIFRRGDDLFHSVREYRLGDNPKLIHWRLSGKHNGRLYLKEYEAEMGDVVAIVLDSRGFTPGSKDLDKLVEFTATLIDELVRESRSFIFASGNFFISVMQRPAHNDRISIFRFLASVKGGQAVADLRKLEGWACHRVLYLASDNSVPSLPTSIPETMKISPENLDLYFLPDTVEKKEKTITSVEITKTSDTESVLNGKQEELNSQAGETETI